MQSEKQAGRLRLALASWVLLASPVVLAAGLGEPCGGAGGISCTGGSWCDPPPGSCGRAGAKGVCVDPERHCHHNYFPVCGCDGRTYSNNCARWHSKVPAAHSGRCSVR